MEAALLSLDMTFTMALKPKVFTKDHIAMLGPLGLGARGWQQLADWKCIDWPSFKLEVE